METIDTAPAKNTDRRKRRLIIIIIAVAAALLCALVLWLVLRDRGVLSGTPTLTIETPDKREAGDAEEFSLDVTLSDLGDAIYPAASFSIGFDRSRLEFLGIAEGNLCVTGDGAPELPEWSVNVERSNRDGAVNIMYLDISGGRYAFSRELLSEKDKNVVFRLRFSLRGSARSGDVYGVEFSDAVFAASDESSSLSMAQSSLRVRNARIAVK